MARHHPPRPAMALQWRLKRPRGSIDVDRHLGTQTGLHVQETGSLGDSPTWIGHLIYPHFCNSDSKKDMETYRNQTSHAWRTSCQRQKRTSLIRQATSVCKAAVCTTCFGNAAPLDTSAAILVTLSKTSGKRRLLPTHVHVKFERT